MEQRKNLCTWLLEEPAGLVQTVILTDEKVFVFNQGPNHKSDVRCSTENPQEVFEANDRNAKKVNMFVVIVDGDTRIVHAFVGTDGKKQSVNGSCYLELLQEVWPSLKHKAAGRSYWWMQDRDPPHSTTFAFVFLHEKFCGQVLSRGTPIHWPDLNALDFNFWGEAQQQMYCGQPGSIKSLI